MSNSQGFLPKRQIDLSNYGAQVLGVLAPGDLGPAVFNLTDAQVAEIDALVSEHGAQLAKVLGLRDTLKGATKALSGRKGTYVRLSAKLRRYANIARASDAPESALIKIGWPRRKARGSRRNAPDSAPWLSVRDVIPGSIYIGFSEIGSASPRARAANTMGVHIAVVDAANPKTNGEADNAPIKTVSHSPMHLATKGWPAQARLYGRWFTARGEVSPWSGAVPVTVR